MECLVFFEREECFLTETAPPVAMGAEAIVVGGREKSGVDSIRDESEIRSRVASVNAIDWVGAGRKPVTTAKGYQKGRAAKP